MIIATQVPIEADRIKRIQDWLVKDECRWFEECLRGMIAKYQAEATNFMLEKPHIVLVEKTMPEEAHNLLRNAAALQIVLETLSKLASPNSPLFRTDLTPGSPAKPPAPSLPQNST